MQDNSDSVYRIDNVNNIATEFIRCDTGNDPESIDVDPNGNVWISTTRGIFRAEKNF